MRTEGQTDRYVDRQTHRHYSSFVHFSQLFCKRALRTSQNKVFASAYLYLVSYSILWAEKAT
jgi:hypothetical protein